jgi:hypothetical protein
MVLKPDRENYEESENDEDHEADTNRPSIDRCIELVTDNNIGFRAAVMY